MKVGDDEVSAAPYDNARPQGSRPLIQMSRPKDRRGAAAAGRSRRRSRRRPERPSRGPAAAGATTSASARRRRAPPRRRGGASPAGRRTGRGPDGGRALAPRPRPRPPLLPPRATTSRRIKPVSCSRMGLVDRRPVNHPRRNVRSPSVTGHRTRPSLAASRTATPDRTHHLTARACKPHARHHVGWRPSASWPIPASHQSSLVPRPGGARCIAAAAHRPRTRVIRRWGALDEGRAPAEHPCARRRRGPACRSPRRTRSLSTAAGARRTWPALEPGPRRRP